MAAPSTEVTHGTLINTTPTDETSLLITKMTQTFSRERKELKGAVTQAVQKVRERNPLLVIKLEGAVSATGSGYATLNAGAEPSAVANFAATTRGIDPTAGTTVCGDIEDTHDRDPDLDAYWTMSCTLTHYSYVV